MHSQFALIASQNPDGIAVIDGEDSSQYTYREIDEMSTLLASSLYHEFGVRPGTSTGENGPKSGVRKSGTLTHGTTPLRRASARASLVTQS